MAEKKPPSRARTPWWSEAGPSPKPPSDQSDVPPETPGRSSSTEWFDRREPFLNALAARLMPLEERAQRIETDLAGFREDVRAYAEETGRTLGELEKELAGLRDRADEHAGRLEQRLGTGFHELGDAQESLRARVDEVEETTGGRIVELERVVLEDLAGKAEESDGRVVEVERSLRGRVEEIEGSIRTRVDEIETTLRSRVDEVASALGAAIGSVQARVDRSPAGTDVDSLRSALGAAAESLRREVAESRQALEASLTKTAERMHADQTKVAERARTDQANTSERLVGRLSKSINELEAGFARVSRLADVIETLGRKRAFNELVESEHALREEQAALAGQLQQAAASVAGLATNLGGRIDGLEERLRGAGEKLSALDRIPVEASDRVADAIERVRGTLEDALGERFAGEVGESIAKLRSELEAGVPVKEVLTRLHELARSQEDVSRAQREVEELSSSLRSDVTRLRKAIEGWGRPQTAPQLAQQLRAIDQRVSSVEGEVRGLVEAVSARVTEQVLEALESRKRRGLLRR
jgi:phage-related tail protein